MMGRHSNIVLIGSDGHILDAARRRYLFPQWLVLPDCPTVPAEGRFNLQTDRPEDIVTACRIKVPT